MKILAGVGENKAIIEAAHNVPFQVILAYSEEEFMDYYLRGEADAYVRGSLEASLLISELRENCRDIYRAACLETGEYKFFLAPVGIDEGDLLSQKTEIIRLATVLLNDLGLEPKIAVLSGGRSQDKGRSRKIDESIAQGESLTSITRHKYGVKHYFILIEEAVADHANFIIAPDGISGNLIFRSLVFLGSGISHGAVTLGINEILIDTSRSQNMEGYIRALRFAKYLAENRKNNEK